MWPFKKKVESKVKPKPTPVRSKELTQLDQWINVGDKFEYMGVEFFLVKKFGVKFVSSGFVAVGQYTYPDVIGEYVDSNGIFREKNFSMDQVESIINHTLQGE